MESVDPLLLGVHKARPEKGFDVLPRYIPRDVDAQLHETMRAAAKHGGFILLTGDSATGKTRTAYCAIRSTLAGYRALSPTPGTDLRQLFANIDNTSHRHILWLDDLEGHLASHGLQVDLLADLLDQRVVVVATMRDEQYERFRLHNARKTPHDENSRIQREMYLGAQVLNLATCIPISRKWSPAEIDRANTSDNPRLHEALQRQDLYAIPEYVAAGPQLMTTPARRRPNRPCHRSCSSPHGSHQAVAFATVTAGSHCCPIWITSLQVRRGDPGGV